MNKAIIIIIGLIFVGGCNFETCPNTEIELKSAIEVRLNIIQFRETNTFIDCYDYCQKFYWKESLGKTCFRQEYCIDLCR